MFFYKRNSLFFSQRKLTHVNDHLISKFRKRVNTSQPLQKAHILFSPQFSILANTQLKLLSRLVDPLLSHLCVVYIGELVDLDLNMHEMVAAEPTINQSQCKHYIYDQTI